MQAQNAVVSAAADSVRAAVDTAKAAGDAVMRWDHTGIDSIVAGKGIMIAIVGIIIVFAALTLISVLIRLLKKFAAHRPAPAVAEEPPVTNGVSGEVVAAIAAALQHHLFELHDEERTIITIKKVSKPYSPWSSKLYGMTPSPFKHISHR